MARLEMTIFEKALDDGPLTKLISLDPTTGEAVSDSSECRLISGYAARLPLKSLRDLATILSGCTSQMALALGSMVDNVQPSKGTRTVPVSTIRRLPNASKGTIARSQEFFEFRQDQPGFMLLDLDFKGMPENVRTSVDAAGGAWDAIVAAVPGLATAGRVERLSTSAGIVNTVTERAFPNSGGMHIYIPVTNGADFPRALQNIFDRLWLAGLGWGWVSNKGSVYMRSLVDVTVGRPERLIFEGGAVCVPPLDQDTAARKPKVTEGPAIDTGLVLPPLTESERQSVLIAKGAARQAVKEMALKKRYEANKRTADDLVEKTGMPFSPAFELASSRHKGELAPQIELEFDDPTIGVVTVSDVMADPDSFIGETLADPLEGIGYGRCKAIILRGEMGEIIIHSFAHGGAVYRLFHREASLSQFVTGLPSESFLTSFADAMQDLMADEGAYERLRQMAIERTGGKAKPVNNALKKAKEARSKARAARAAAKSNDFGQDHRIVMDAPAHNAERVDTVKPIDAALAAVKTNDRLLRGRDGKMALVNQKSELPLYGLLEVDNTDESDHANRLPLAPTYAIELLIPAQVQMEIERFVRFEELDQMGRIVKVALRMQFCEALNLLRETLVPTVYGVQTMPIVIGREIVASSGFNEEFGIYFAIDPELLEILPREHECTLEATKKEFDWLCDEWLGDVATDLKGKTCAIAMAMTIIVRHVVKLMPFFLARAGQRGSGKTTLLNMIIMAVTGILAPAAAWSPRAEERRKALFSYMMRDLPALVLDNIERGTDIKCPHLSAYSTAGKISDRELGKSNAMTLPATTVVCFSGNSVNPGGDIASRTISIDLDAKRADPENRPFKHEDPITFTTNNRKRILRALYTVLCMQRAVPTKASTRFKEWWRAVGHPLELLTGVSFDRIMEENEAVDEEASASAQLFEALGDKFGYNGQFTARDVRRELLDPDHGVPPFDPPMTEAARNLRAVKKEAVDDFRGMLEEASPGGRALPHGVPNAMRIGHRLLALAGRTVESNGRTLQLQMETTRDKINRFAVVVLHAGAAKEADRGRKRPSNRPKKSNGQAKPTREEIHAVITTAMAEDAADAGTSQS